MRASFLDPATSVALDLIRATAALVVLIGHAGQLGLFGSSWPLPVAMQHVAVVIFFVLSGIVIRATADRPGMTPARYAHARARRILPVALPALLFALAANGIVAQSGSDAVSPDPITFRTLLLPVLFLSEGSGGAGAILNPPYWSLCYEVAYYALFGVWRFAAGRRRMLLLVLVAAIAGPRPLLLLPVWLLGVWLAGSRWALSRSRRQGAVCLLAGLGGFGASTLIAATSPFIAAKQLLAAAGMRFSEFAAADLLLGASVMLALAGLRGLLANRPPPPPAVARAARTLAAMSFPLYLLHWPTLAAMRASGLVADGSPARFVLLLGVPILLAAGSARLIETRRLRRAIGAPRFDRPALT